MNNLITISKTKMRLVPKKKKKFVERRSSYIKQKLKTGFVFLHKKLKVKNWKIIIKYSSLPIAYYS